MRILLTGANGFIGAHLGKLLSGAGHCVVGTARTSVGLDPSRQWVVTGEGAGMGLDRALEGIDAVVHAAGATPSNAGRGGSAPAAFRDSVEFSRRLAAAVSASGARSVIHLSSVAVLGPAEIRGGASLDDAAESDPRTDYGRAKLESERILDEAAAADRPVVHLRPPLVFGAGARGTWASLERLARSPLPLPFASVANRRSFLGIGNLASLVEAVLAKAGSGALGGAYLAADRETVSLREVCAALRGALGRKPGLLPVPPAILVSALRIVGRGKAADGLCGDLVVDASRARGTFSWNPSEPTLEAMARSISTST
jgi:UDP-glucose 4-epimerase